MKLLRRIKHDIKMNRLYKNFDYVIGKMLEHEQDVDSSEWKAWATLNLIYLMLMTEETKQYAKKR